MPGKKKKYNARFPPARIKKIMQSDEEVGKVAAPVPVIISRALELFVQSLLHQAGEITTTRKARTLTVSHLKQCIMSEQRFDFLQELVMAIPDVTADSEVYDTPSPLPMPKSNIPQFPVIDSNGPPPMKTTRGRGRGRGRPPLDRTNSYKFSRNRRRNSQDHSSLPSTSTLQDDDESDEALELDLNSSSVDESDDEKSLNHHSKKKVQLTHLKEKKNNFSSILSNPLKRSHSDPSPETSFSSLPNLPGGIQISIGSVLLPTPKQSIIAPPSKLISAPDEQNGKNNDGAVNETTSVPVSVITSLEAATKHTKSMYKGEIDEDYDC